MSMPLNAVNWVEIPVVDLERAQRFYSAIYDYEMPIQPMDKLMMGFLPFQMGQGVGAAVVFGEGYVPSHDGPKIYLNGGDDLQQVLDRVNGAGGAVVMGKTEITPEIGYFAVFDDTEGNRLYLHSPH